MATSNITVTALNGVKVYNLTSGKTLPEWLAEGKKTALRKDLEYRNRVELLQDFDFNTASHRVKVTPDGEFMVATGTYPPMVKVFELRELSMKFERHLDCEVVDLAVLGSSWGKLAFLLADRTVEFHAPYGRHYSTRVPKFGRAMLYNQHTCDLIVGASGNDVYRLNLDEGRFMAPLPSGSPAVNALALSSAYQLLATAGEDGVVELWDTRADGKRRGKPAGKLDVSGLGDSATGSNQQEATAVEFDPRGMTLAVGTSGGHVGLFDLRSTAPRIHKEHQYEDPILCIRFHPSTGNVISADQHIIKIWNADTGKIFTNIEPPSSVADVCLVPNSRAKPQATAAALGGGLADSYSHSTGATDSGLMVVAGEQPRVMAFFVPELGVAPNWCSFVDSLTEELEQTKTNDVFDQYKFISLDEMKALGMQHLIGTPLVKSYMHGFFVDARLYARIHTAADPHAFDRWRKERVKAKLEEKRQSRITIRKRLPRVNREMAVRLISSSAKKSKQVRQALDGDEDGVGSGADEASATPAPQGGGAGGGAGASASTAAAAAAAESTFSNPLGDDRFARLFTDSAFQIDVESEEYQYRHATVGARDKSARAEAAADATTTSSSHADPAVAALFDAVDGDSGDDDVPSGSRDKTRMFAVKDEAVSAAAAVTPGSARSARSSRSRRGSSGRADGVVVGLGGATDRKAIAHSRRMQAMRATPLSKRVAQQESATAAAARRRAATGISAVREGPGYLEVSVSSQAAAAAAREARLQRNDDGRGIMTPQGKRTALGDLPPDLEDERRAATTGKKRSSRKKRGSSSGKRKKQRR